MFKPWDKNKIPWKPNLVLALKIGGSSRLNLEKSLIDLNVNHLKFFKDFQGILIFFKVFSNFIKDFQGFLKIFKDFWGFSRIFKDLNYSTLDLESTFLDKPCLEVQGISRITLEISLIFSTLQPLTWIWKIMKILPLTWKKLELQGQGQGSLLVKVSAGHPNLYSFAIALCNVQSFAIAFSN